MTAEEAQDAQDAQEEWPHTRELLDARERFAFERGMQRLRLTFLASPFLVCASFGWAALPFAVQIVMVTLGSYAVIAVGLHRAPKVVLRWQMALRVIDCLLAYFVLVNYHAFLGNAYYDSVYALFTVAAAATHGRRGALLIGTLSGALVLAGRMQLVAAGVLQFQIRHVTDGIYYAVFYSATGLAVAHLMRLSGRVVERREREWREQLAVNNATLLDLAHRLRTSNSALAESAAQLAATNKELEAFAYSVSHDLRAPLRSIDGFSRIVADAYADSLDERARDYLGRVRAAARRMGDLIDGLLGLSRLTRAPLRVAELDLAPLARAVAGELRERDPQRSVTWIIPEHVPACGDEELLRVLLENLLGNAWKFTAKHAAATIELGVRRGEVSGDGESKEVWEETVYYVRDDGAGFDMTYADKLFGAFQRLHNAAEYEGTGIGLATVQRIVRRHGGRIWAEGEVGRGATFFFTLAEPA